MVGRGVGKKDFATGLVKGSLKVDADGFASIAHTLKADQTTEGAESLKIQIFSDKKMRKLIGQSDAVRIGDISVKASKGRRGGSIQDGVRKDDVTDLFLMSGYGKIVSDKYYDKSSEVVKRSGASGLQGTEWELSRNLMIVTAQFINTDGSDRYRRIAYSGDFVIRSQEVVAARIASVGVYEYDEFSGKVSESLDVTNFSPSRIVEDVRIPGQFEEAVSNDDVPRSLDAYRVDGRVTTDIGDFNDIFAFGGGRVFQPGWWNDAFTPDLI